MVRLEQRVADVCSAIEPLDQRAMRSMQERLDSLTKPVGSLGRLERLAVQLAGINGIAGNCKNKRVVIMASDHGVTAEGVSAYPPQVTVEMVKNFCRGGAAINVLARCMSVEVQVVDMGLFTDPELEEVTSIRIRPGTANMVTDAAMSRQEAVAAVMAGVDCATSAVRQGIHVLATGEMGIGNTTASSAVLAALTGYEPAKVVGPGTGISSEGLVHKKQVVSSVLRLHEPDRKDPIDVLSKVGGLDIAGLTGLILGAANNRVPIVIDGFIATVAAIVAVSLEPLTLNYMIPSHESAEPGHRLALDYLKMKPYFDLEMRLGEGTGAVLAMSLLQSAADIASEMATFAEAGVSKA